jgi:Fe-S-cluster containining protein
MLNNQMQIKVMQIEQESGSIPMTEGLGHILHGLPPQTATSIIRMIEDYTKEFQRLTNKHNEASVLYNFYELAETYNNEIPATDKTISCRKGCSHCCHIQVILTEAEARCIQAYCKDNKIQIDYNYLQKQASFNVSTHAQSEHSACVFLKDHQCSIYSARPFACRNYFVVSPPDLCDSKKHLKEKVLTYINIYKEAIHSAFLNYLRKKGKSWKQDSIARIFLAMKRKEL